MIREPFSRIASHYCYSRHLADPKMRQKIRRHWGTQSFSSCVMSANMTDCFNQPRSEYIYFCGPEDDPKCIEKVPTLNDLSVKCQLGPEEQVELAMKHLNEHYFCGITEQFEKSVEIFQILFPDFFQRAPILDPHLNQAIKSQLSCRQLQNATEVRNTLKEKSLLLQRDQKMYDFALKQFWGCYEHLNLGRKTESKK